MFPDYHYALAQLADLRLQQGRLADAVALRQRHYAAAPHAENQFELGRALARAGREKAAREAWTQFEMSALREAANVDNANVELIYYYADDPNRPADALAIAQRDAARRQDVRTLEALAWALHKNGRSREALAEITKVLAVGVTNAVTFYHAGAIAAAAGQTREARGFLEKSLATCGDSLVAEPARKLLAALAAGFKVQVSGIR